MRKFFSILSIALLAGTASFPTSSWAMDGEQDRSIPPSPAKAISQLATKTTEHDLVRQCSATPIPPEVPPGHKAVYERLLKGVAVYHPTEGSDETRGVGASIPSLVRLCQKFIRDLSTYEMFLKGKLVYRPTEGSDVGKMELPIAALANPLEGTFDLSSCGDTGQYLSIATGYRKGKIPANASKVEIWFTPRFLVDRELSAMAMNHHIRAITTGGNWDGTKAPVGIFWTWGGWDASNQMNYCDYLTTETPENLGSETLYKKYKKSRDRSHISSLDGNHASEGGALGKFHISLVN